MTEAPYHPLFSWKSHRLRLVFLFCAGLWVSSSMRLNLGFATVCMVNSTAYPAPVVTREYGEERGADSEGCAAGNWTVHNGYNGSILWTPSEQSLIMGGTFYGGMVTIWISGYLADRFGPKILILLAVLDYSIMTLLSPIAAEHSYPVFFALRMVMGLGEGFIIPCFNSISSKWFPTHEKSTMAAIFTSGNQLAAALTPLFSSFLCSSSFQWPSIFYVYGCLGLMWMCLWILFATNSPQTNRYASDEEKQYLNETVTVRSGLPKGITVPWFRLLFDKTLLAVYVCTFCDMICVIVMQGYLPIFLKDVLRLPIHQNGLYTMLPFLCQMVTKNILAPVSDYLKRRKIITPTTSVRIFQSISCFGGALTLILMATVPDCRHPYLALPILALYGSLYSACTCGYFTAMISVTPAFAGTVSSFARSYGTLGSLFGTNMVSILAATGTPYKWQFIFGITAAFKIASGFFFIRYGSADPQPWAETPIKP